MLFWSILRPFGIFGAHLHSIFCGPLVYFFHFGILHQEISGNRALNSGDSFTNRKPLHHRPDPRRGSLLGCSPGHGGHTQRQGDHPEKAWIWQLPPTNPDVCYWPR
jgi:hypothetical protein